MEEDTFNNSALLWTLGGGQKDVMDGWYSNAPISIHHSIHSNTLFFFSTYVQEKAWGRHTSVRDGRSIHNLAMQNTPSSVTWSTYWSVELSTVESTGMQIDFSCGKSTTHSHPGGELRRMNSDESLHPYSESMDSLPNWMEVNSGKSSSSQAHESLTFQHKTPTCVQPFTA